MNVNRQLWMAWPWTLSLCILMTGIAPAEPPAISDPGNNLPTGNEMPGQFPETVTAANMNVAPIAGSQLGGSGSNDQLVSFPSSGPIAWTDMRHNEGDIALGIGPFDPTDSSYFPPATHGEWKPLEGQPFSNTTLSWRVNNNLGALLATVRHNGVDNGDSFAGSPVGITHGVANFVVGFSQGWGFRMNDGEFANGGNGSSDLIMGMAGFDDGNQEASFNVATASFPYAEGWLGAWVDADTGGEATFAAANPDVQTSSVNWSNGSARVILPGVDSASDGMLFVSPSDSSSQTKIAAGAPRAGGWDITIRDDEDSDTTGQTLAGSSQFQFLYVPYDANGLIGGQVNGEDGSLANSAGNDRFNLTRNGDGEYALSVFDTGAGAQTKLTEDDGMLILSVASHMADTTDVADRSFLSYEYDPDSGDFIIQSREVAATSSPNSENQFGDWLKLRDSDFYFSFVDFTNPVNLFDADVDSDGDVDGGDFLAIQRTDPAKIAAWQGQFGNLTGALNAVPEPASAVLLLGLAGICLLGCRPRRRNS